MWKTTCTSYIPGLVRITGAHTRGKCSITAILFVCGFYKQIAYGIGWWFDSKKINYLQFSDNFGEFVIVHVEHVVIKRGFCNKRGFSPELCGKRCPTEGQVDFHRFANVLPCGSMPPMASVWETVNGKTITSKMLLNGRNAVDSLSRISAGAYCRPPFHLLPSNRNRIKLVKMS